MTDPTEYRPWATLDEEERECVRESYRQDQRHRAALHQQSVEEAPMRRAALRVEAPNMSERLLNVLFNAQCWSLKEAAELGYGFWYCQPNCGRVTLEELSLLFSLNGLSVNE